MVTSAGEGAETCASPGRPSSSTLCILAPGHFRSAGSPPGPQPLCGWLLLASEKVCGAQRQHADAGGPAVTGEGRGKAGEARRGWGTPQTGPALDSLSHSRRSQLRETPREHKYAGRTWGREELRQKPDCQSPVPTEEGLRPKLAPSAKIGTPSSIPLWKQQNVSAPCAS